MKGTKSIYIFLGPPGAGKGTLSQLCQDRLGWLQLSTGVLCRSHIARQTEIGKKIDLAIKSGKLVEDSLICQMVQEWLLDNADQLEKGLILDGFPRTVAQAEQLCDFLTKHLSGCHIRIVRLKISNDRVIRRLAGRVVCKNSDCQRVYSLYKNDSGELLQIDACDKCSGQLMRRADDEEATVEKRLHTYYQHENDLLGFFATAGLPVNQVDVDVSPEYVFEMFKQAVGTHG
jgi:adenylate kinase